MLADYWEQEELHLGITSPHAAYAITRKLEKLQNKNIDRNIQLEKRNNIQLEDPINNSDQINSNNNNNNDQVINNHENDNIILKEDDVTTSDSNTNNESIGYYSRLNAKKKSPERTIREHINITKAPFRTDPRPIDEKCQCYTCKNFSRAYLHHLFKAKELLGGTLVTIHNVHFMNKLMEDIRYLIDL